MREMAEEYPGGTRAEKEIQINKIKAHIASLTDIPDELKEALGSSLESPLFLELIYKRGGKTSHFQIGQLGWKFWAINSDNLKLVDTLGATALAIAAFAAVATASPVVLAATLIVSTISLADRLRTKGVTLSEEQHHILMTMKASGPLSVTDLATRLSGLHIYGKDVWTEDRTTKALDKLMLVHLGDGTVEALVVQANGTWAVNGI